MSEIIKSEEISRRKALSFLGLVATFNLAASSTALSVSEAEAQTVGMERRHERRAGRTERRQVRRTGPRNGARRDERTHGAARGATQLSEVHAIEAARRFRASIAWHEADTTTFDSHSLTV